MAAARRARARGSDPPGSPARRSPARASCSAERKESPESQQSEESEESKEPFMWGGFGGVSEAFRRCGDRTVMPGGPNEG